MSVCAWPDGNELDADADADVEGRRLGGGGGVGCADEAAVLKKESLSEREVEGGEGEDGRRGVVSGSSWALTLAWFWFIVSASA